MTHWFKESEENNKDYCGICGSEETHEIVHCIKCNKKMNPCDEMPNPIEYGKDDWICEGCFHDLEVSGDRD